MQGRNEDFRPDPEVLLKEIQQERRGKLTVFLGAMAGVGKTYAMLEAAQERIKEGIDVVVGWVETHGRKETEELLKGLPIIPPVRIIYRGKEFLEMNVDAIIRRKPALVLVDELAHTNVPGSRHVKRYQDVEEILNEGIDVYTTLNIQHVESLNDIVTQITGVPIKETVPDRLLEMAEIQLVDIPPEELILRFKEGKVYVPEKAEEALKHFFRPGNINALRQLAMRYAAKRVDLQLESYMRIHRIEGPWQVSDRVMVCVSSSPFSARLIRMAKRLAEGIGTDWIAVYVETPERLLSGADEKSQLNKNLELARELGAEVITVSGEDIAEEVVKLAKRKNVTHLIIGKPLRSRLYELFHGSVVNKVIKKSEGIIIHVIPDRSNIEKRRSISYFKINVSTYIHYIEVLILDAIITIFNHTFKENLGILNIGMSFLLPILIVSIHGGILPGVIAAVINIVLFDILFIPPTGSFSVSDLRYIITFIIFLLVGFFTGSLSQRIKVEIKKWRERGDNLEALYSLSRDIAALADFEEVLNKIVERMYEILQKPVALILPNERGTLQVKATSGEWTEDFWDENEKGVATWVFRKGEKAGRGTDTLNNAKGFYLPLQVGKRAEGVMGIYLCDDIEKEKLLLAEAFAGLIAVAINRVRLYKQAQEAKFVAESEKVRSAIFNSISHDLRTPLSSIIGAVTTLLDNDKGFDSVHKRELLQTIKQEAIRMNRFITNLLNVARLESGELKLKDEWIDIQDVIGVAIRRLGEILKSRTLVLNIPSDLPLVKGDFILLEQVFVNLLDNAVKYSKSNSEIYLNVKPTSKWIEVSISNKGPKLSDEDLERIFDKFYRVPSSSDVTGTGLGLTICKEIVEAHKGRIWAYNHAEGLTIAFTIPLPEIEIGEIPPTKRGDAGE
ncbi:sensor histidine kinase KdpD [Caldicellulosiruptor changbaiensis]|uniref:histidine kinase n=1 Tax=Caldicellulosiruptor changbaiensis TaxID=1222016 RepID=A0A3T0D462_9FIRM|nr:sensor histidine kinase KdpD [Caldicellulosiruptor changbaiensis]AZT89693.1 sensor histidine kinase KdpD [Caldicellulosiruptor changbaiensis]